MRWICNYVGLFFAIKKEEERFTEINLIRWEEPRRCCVLVR